MSTVLRPLRRHVSSPSTPTVYFPPLCQWRPWQWPSITTTFQLLICPHLLFIIIIIIILIIVIFFTTTAYHSLPLPPSPLSRIPPPLYPNLISVRKNINWVLEEVHIHTGDSKIWGNTSVKHILAITRKKPCAMVRKITKKKKNKNM